MLVRLAGLALTALVLAACSGQAPTGQRPAAAGSPTVARSAVADSFRSARSYPAVAAPVRLRIPAAGVDSALERVGRAVDGTMQLPRRPGDAAWYAQGPRPGQAGPAVLIGHVDWDSGPAVFYHLRELRPGDAVYVERADGSTGTFRVTGSVKVPKDRFPTDLVYAPSLEPSLRLVTCGGSFDHASRNYRDNVIVLAAPA